MNPEQIAAIRAREDRAGNELTRMLMSPGGPGASWRWSIPANPERDTDLILADSIADIPILLAALEKAEERAEARAIEAHAAADVVVSLTEDSDALKAALAAAEARATAAERELAELRPAPCDLKHQEPYDFAYCETHDTTFALGEKCKFDGRDPFEIAYEEASEQRQRAVRAEMEGERWEARATAAEARVAKALSLAFGYRASARFATPEALQGALIEAWSNMVDALGESS